MAIKPVSGEIKAQVINDNFSVLDSQLTNLSIGPFDTYTSLSILQSAYPNGRNGFAVVLEADGKTGYMYTWTGTTWKKGGLAQSQGIGDGTVTKPKIAFNPYQKISYYKTNFDETALDYDEDGNLIMGRDLGAPYHQNKIQFNRPDESVKVLSATFRPKKSADSNRVFIGYSENYYIVFNVEQEGLVTAYKVADGEMEQNVFSFNSGMTSGEYYAGFELTIVVAGTNVAIYFNKKLRTVLQRLALFSGAFSSAGLVFRGSDTQYNAHVNNVRYITQPKKYAHISIDDVNGILKDISGNATTYQSIFDNASLKFYRDLHLKYGAVFSLYLFKIGQSGFDVATVPTKFKNEFTANASWLKFGFHSKDADTDYILSDGTDLLADYKATINAIRNFASELSIDTIPRFHAFGAAKAAQIVLKNSKSSFDGMYSADDNRENNAGLSGEALALIRRADDYADFQNDLYYVKSETRLDGKTKAQAIEILENCYKDISNNNIYAMFFHEGFDRTEENKETLEEVCKWIFGRGIQFDYPMRNKPVI